jgi:hypothetical protein
VIVKLMSSVDTRKSEAIWGIAGKYKFDARGLIEGEILCGSQKQTDLKNPAMAAIATMTHFSRLVNMENGPVSSFGVTGGLSEAAVIEVSAGIGSLTPGSS